MLSRLCDYTLVGRASTTWTKHLVFPCGWTCLRDFWVSFPNPQRRIITLLITLSSASPIYRNEDNGRIPGDTRSGDGHNHSLFITTPIHYGQRQNLGSINQIVNIHPLVGGMHLLCQARAKNYWRCITVFYKVSGISCPLSAGDLRLFPGDNGKFFTHSFDDWVTLFSFTSGVRAIASSMFWATFPRVPRSIILPPS